MPWLHARSLILLQCTGSFSRILHQLRYLLVLFLMCRYFTLLSAKEIDTEETDGTTFLGIYVFPDTVSCAPLFIQLEEFLTIHSGWVLIVISVTLLECGAIRKSYFDFQIALNLFFNLGNYLLLVIVVWGVNSLLAERVENRHSAVKIITLLITGVMGALTAALIGMICYILWTNTSAGQESLDTFAGLQQYYTTVFNYSRYAVAYWALYLLSVIAAGGLAISTITRMRSRNIHVGVSLQFLQTRLRTNKDPGYPALDRCPICLHAAMGCLPVHTLCRQSRPLFHYPTGYIHRHCISQQLLFTFLIHLSHFHQQISGLEKCDGPTIRLQHGWI